MSNLFESWSRLAHARKEGHQEEARAAWEEEGFGARGAQAAAAAAPCPRQRAERARAQGRQVEVDKEEAAA